MTSQLIPTHTNIDITRQLVQTQYETLDSSLRQPGLEHLIYLLLAPKLLENWLKTFPIKIAYNAKNHSLKNPLFGLITEFISGIQLGNLNLCLLVGDRLEPDILEIPEIAVTHPAFIAHLYLFIYIPGEELIGSYFSAKSPEDKIATANILGFVRHDQIINHKKGIRYQSQGYYEVPQVSLDPDFNHLKTCACLIQPEKILAPSSIKKTATTTSIQSIYKKLQPFAQNPTFYQKYIWQNLSLTDSELEIFFLNQDLQTYLGKILLDSDPPTQISTIATAIQSQINLYQWIMETADTLIGSAQQLITPHEFVGTFYDASTPELSDANFSTEQLKQQIRKLLGEAEIPEFKTKLATLPISLNNQNLNLLVGIWLSEHWQQEERWNLILILAAQSSLGFKPETILKIKNNFDATETIVLDESESSYLLMLNPTLSEEINVEVSFQEDYYSQPFVCQIT